MKTLYESDFLVIRDETRCIRCKVCVRQCANEVHQYDEEDDRVVSDNSKCVGCHRCVTMCPTKAITIMRNPLEFRENYQWTERTIKDIYKQSETGGILLTGMGNDKNYPVYWDRLLINASQVTNPSIDPLREPVELKTFIGENLKDWILIAMGIYLQRCLHSWSSKSQ